MLLYLAYLRGLSYLNTDAGNGIDIDRYSRGLSLFFFNFFENRE